MCHRLQSSSQLIQQIYTGKFPLLFYEYRNWRCISYLILLLAKIASNNTSKVWSTENRATDHDEKYRALHRGKISKEFDVENGVNRGCILSSSHFLLVISFPCCLGWRMWRVQWILSSLLKNLDCVDGAYLLSHRVVNLGQTALTRPYIGRCQGREGTIKAAPHSRSIHWGWCPVVDLPSRSSIADW